MKDFIKAGLSAAFLGILLAVISATASAQYSPETGSLERKAIMDALREYR